MARVTAGALTSPRNTIARATVSLLASLCLALSLVGCSGTGTIHEDGGDPDDVAAPTISGAVTLSPTRGVVHGGNLVMVGIAGLPDDLATMEVKARFGSADSVSCEFDNVVRQFACRATGHADPTSVDVVVNANGKDVTPAASYTYTTQGYEDMPVLTLDLAALQRNARVIEDDFPENLGLGVVLKNGEPVGAMAKAISEIGSVDYFFVPKLSDGIALREAGVTIPIAVIYLANTEDIPLMLHYNLEVAAKSVAWVERANAALESMQGELRVHLWIDTGFGPEGVTPDEALGLAKAIAASPHLKLRGIATHLCCVTKDDKKALKNNDLTNKTVLQKSRFDRTVAAIRDAGIGEGVLLHVGASDVLANDLEPLYYDMLRVGGMFFISDAASGELYSWKTSIKQVKKLPKGWCIDYGCETITTKATLVGLVGQIPLRDDPIAFVVRGKTVPVLLNHQTVVTLDLSSIPDAAEGDEVIIKFNPANDQLLDATPPLPVTLKK